MHRPLWRVALVYSGGVVAGYWIAAPLAGVLCLFGALLSGVLLARRARHWLLPPLIFFAGWANFATRMAIISPNDLRALANDRPELVTLRGTLAEPPYQRVFSPDTEDESWRTHAVIEVEAIARQGQWRPAVGTVAVTSPGVLGAEFATDRRVEVFGVLAPPRGLRAEGLFDYQAYLKLRGIHYALHTKEPSDWRLTGAALAPAFTDRFCTWAQRTLQRGLPVEDEALRLSWAMALGWKTALTDEVSEPFMRTGTMHIFAISGLHVALIAGILVALLRVVRLPRAWCGVVAVPLIWFYTAATGWQSSAIRSTVMLTIIIIGWAVRRPGDLLNSLGAAGFIILVWQPEQLFQASFQLSFFVVLSIALLLPPIQNRLERLLAPDPFLPPDLRPRWQRWFDRPLRWIVLSLATSFASWLGSMPLTAYYFHLFTPISLVANLVIVPLSSGALACNLGSLFCGDWLPWAGELFNHAGWALMAAMAWLSRWFAQWPGACWHVLSPTFSETAVYYALLVAVVSGWAFAERRWSWIGPTAALACAALALVRWLPTGDQTAVTVLPLSGGEAIWVDVPGRHQDLLIDCGDERNAEFAVKPFLRAQSVNFLPTIALTHGAVRNVGGWPLIATDFAAQQTVTGVTRFRSAAYRGILAQIERHPERSRQLSRGDSLGPWRVLHPANGDKFANADDGSLVLFGESGGVRVLLLADLGHEGQRLLCDREPGLRTDLVIAGLPGRAEPLELALLATIRPRIVIISDSELPAGQRASGPLRDRLAHAPVELFFTSDHGTLKAILRHGEIRVTNPLGQVLTQLPDSRLKKP